MSVIVKGMKMPECCAGCELSDSDEDGIFCNVLEVFMRFDELPKGRRSDCPLVELIQCKDCVHHHGYICDRLYGLQDAFTLHNNDYCSRAEPKDTTKEVRKQLKDMEQRREMDRKK